MFKSLKFRSALPEPGTFSKQSLLGLTFLSIVALAPGCSRFSPQPADTEEIQAEETDVVTKESLVTAPAEESSTTRDQDRSRELSSVELLWQVPGEPVDTYHLRYGIHPDALTHQVEIKVSELEQIQHPEHGPLYRYLIPSVPADETIYFTIQAENQFGISPESPVQEVAPQ